MKLEDLFEGMYVIKNQDGKEKRFKDHTSPEALAWKKSSATKKPKLAVYSQAYWDAKAIDDSYNGYFPDDKISIEEIADQFPTIAADRGFGQIDDWHIQGQQGLTVVDGVKVRTVPIRVAFSFGKEDDMGLDIQGDERVSDSQHVILRRDPTKPARLVFSKYGN